MSLKTLPGAEVFFEYLESLFPGQTIVIKGPEVLDRSYGMDYVKAYSITVNNSEIGTYKTFGPHPKEEDFIREYRGRLPNYTNEAIRIFNAHRHENETERPEDMVCLSFSNRRFVAQGHDEGPGKLETTPWQRQDGHDSIVFP